MKIAEFRELIANLPASRQAFRSRRTTWEADFQNLDFQNREVPIEARNAFNEIFGDNEDVFISRDDLRLIAQEGNLAKLVIASIFWGYPRGMFGHHFSNILQRLNFIVDHLPAVSTQDWNIHWNAVADIEGLGLSTYSKILYFYSAKVGANNGNGEKFNALILDSRIIDVVRNRVFDELNACNQLQGLSYYNAPHHYVSYLSCVDKLSKKYEVPAENIELFLFQYGKNLKPMAG